MDRELSIKVDETVTLEDGLAVTLTDVVIEEIAPPPQKDGRGMGGSGVAIRLECRKGEETGTLHLNELSEPYVSQKQGEWGGYRFEFLEGHNYYRADTTITLRIRTSL